MKNIENNNTGSAVVSSTVDELINDSTIIIPEELKGDVTLFASLRDGYGYDELDEEREELISKLLLANTKTTSSSEFWNGFDLVNANQYQLADYILEHSDFNEEKQNESKDDKETEHFLIYMIQNKINGKIYVGQHHTYDIYDDYMGSGKVIKLAENRYGIENFKKTILFDFKTFDEMNQKESDIVTDTFWRKGTVYTTDIAEGYMVLARNSRRRCIGLDYGSHVLKGVLFIIMNPVK